MWYAEEEKGMPLLSWGQGECENKTLQQKYPENVKDIILPKLNNIKSH